MLIYIIVFKEDTERRHLLTARFREIGLEPTFIDAIRAVSCPPRNRNFRACPGKSGPKRHFAAMP